MQRCRSLLNWLERLIRRRKECPEVGWGDWELLDAGDAAVLAHRCTWNDRNLVAVHSFADTPRRVTLPLDGSAPVLLGDAGAGASDGPEVALAPYGYRWLRAG